MLWSEEEVEKFIEEVVPDLEKDEVLCVTLVARKKYANISRSVELLDKLIIKNKQSMLRKLRKFLRIEEGDYIDHKTGKPIPLKALAVYVDLCPKSCLKAITLWMKTAMEWQYQAIAGTLDLEIFKKLDTKWFSSVHKSNSRKPVAVVDVDKKYLLNAPHPDWITETRGGYHLIYKEPSKETMRQLYLLSERYDFVELFRNQARTVIPGTIQGGFKVRRIDPNDS